MHEHCDINSRSSEDGFSSFLVLIFQTTEFLKYLTTWLKKKKKQLLLYICLAKNKDKSVQLRIDSMVMLHRDIRLERHTDLIVKKWQLEMGSLLGS